MNLSSDKNAIYKSDYLNFLLSICKYKNQGINLNQENIYKKFKKYSSIRAKLKFDKYFQTWIS